jgi:thiol peroxidase
VNERTGIVTVVGKPVTLLGDEVRSGDHAPDFYAVKNDLSTFRFSELRGKTVIIAAVPSLDTPVCDLEAQTFNERAMELAEGVVVLVISMDLPFAQRRWCGDHGADRIVTVSDHRDASFGTAYGVLMKESRLLARSVFVVDRDGIVRYVEIMDDISHQPDFEAALAAARELLSETK